MKKLFRFTRQPELEDASLIVGWERDAGNVAKKVIDHIIKSIKGTDFCEIEPVDFFQLGGVEVENDVARFSGNRFIAGEMNNLILFMGNEPQFNHFRFLNVLLDVVQQHFRIRELYTVSATVSSIPFSSPRRILAVYNTQEFKNSLRNYGLVDMTWEGPPALNSFLLFTAQIRRIPGVSLWPEIPFYLATVDDYQAQRSTLEFFNKKFNLQIGLDILDEAIRRQSSEILKLREQDPQVDHHMKLMDENISLSQEDNIYLANKISQFLFKK